MFIHSSTLQKKIQKPLTIMASSIEPTAILSHLHRADGSATFSQNGYTVIGAVNGPLEVQRRDELPEEAVIDVIVRPAAGVGGPYLQSRSSSMWTYSNLWSFRYAGTTSRIHHAVHPPPNHPHSQFPANPNSGHITDHEHTRE